MNPISNGSPAVVEIPDEDISSGIERTFARLSARVAQVASEFSSVDASPESLMTRARNAEAKLIVSNSALLALSRLVETSAENLRLSDVALRALSKDAAEEKEKLHSSELTVLALTKLTENAKQAMSVGATALEALNAMAFYDPLTDLPNRRLLLDRLKQALHVTSRNSQFGALLYIDLDNFKSVNDTMGHAVGDQLLQMVAKRLTDCVRASDTVARLGGDEYVVMLECVGEKISTAALEAKKVAQKILSGFEHVFHLENYPCLMTASVGITLFSASRNDTVSEVLKQSDLAMYAAKAEGRNTLRFYDEKMQAIANENAELEAALRTALRDGQFRLFYQVQVDEQGNSFASEALIRWQHPTKGMLSPNVFIPIAEDTGLILPIGRWVLETACRQLAEWAGDPLMKHMMIAVNVSARQFHQEDFLEQVLSILAATGASPHHLKLELTESVLVKDVEGTVSKIAALRKRGVHFALDDFGTGFSSLSYLRRLPLDQLKIDKSFVDGIPADLNACAIVRTIIVLGNALGFRVVAEGVESPAQRDFLAANGCIYYQGYLYGQPLSREDFEACLRAGVPAA